MSALSSGTGFTVEVEPGRQSLQRTLFLNAPFQKFVCLKISRTGSQFEHGIFKSQYDNVLRPLPIFGSGDDSYSTQVAKAASSWQGVLLCGRAFRRRTNREAAARRRNQMLRSGLSNVGALVITPCDPMRPMGAVARAAALLSSIGAPMKLHRIPT